MESVTLAQVLQARENRADIQRRLLSENHAVLSFCMNIPGPVKTSPLIIRTFELGLSLLYKVFKENDIKILNRVDIRQITGPEMICSLSCPADKAKELCLSIEDNCTAGRLFDMDVLDTDGSKLERKEERECLVCGKSGRYCASRRIHTVEELQQAVIRIMVSTFFEYDKNAISSLASSALEKEIKTTPKPGLVDMNNTGSHKDMGIGTFRKSIDSLSSYWGECFETGVRYTGDNCFSILREKGKTAEKNMLEATGGVNTHKGVIFLLGTLCCACGRLWKADKPCSDPALLAKECMKLYAQEAKNDYKGIREGKELTKGEKIYLEYGLKGARGELESGFESVLHYSLPFFEKALSEGYSENDSAVYTLLSLIALGKDTNMIARGGKTKADAFSLSVKELINKGRYPSMEKVKKMDEEFISENLSPGGCADLLAISIFMHDLHCFYAK